jgi:histidyl-tRNA synthetase
MISRGTTHPVYVQAQKVVQHLQKVGTATGAETFVWTKKVEKELSEGKKVKDISIFTDQQRQSERLVSWVDRHA